MSIFQIWGSFTDDDPEFPTTTATFRKGQMAGGGMTMEQMEREFAEEDGEELVLLYEFDPFEELRKQDVHEHLPSEEMETAIAHMVSQAFMEGRMWEKEDDADSQDEP